MCKQASYQYSIVLIFISIVVFSLMPQHIFALYDSLYYNGLDRTYLVHLPPGYNEHDSPLPLILAFHGGYGDAFKVTIYENNQPRYIPFI